MHRLLADIRAFDEARYWYDEGAVSCAAWLSWRVGWTPGTGREHVHVARALGLLPLIDAALRDGRLSYSKVRAITRVATPATEAVLLNDAIHTTAAQLEIICRKFGTVQRLQQQSPEEVRARRTVRRRDRDDGMVVIEAVLPADEAALVFAAIEAAAARLAQGAADASSRRPAASRASAEAPPPPAATRVPAETPPPPAATHVSAETPPPPAAHVSAETRAAPRLDRADGLVALAQEALRGRTPDRSPVEVVLTISHAALTASPAVSAATGTDAPIAGSSSTLAVGTFADGTCVSAETARRLACDGGIVELHEDAAGQPLSVGRRTRAIPAAIGGETSLGNLVKLCGHHHRYLHEHGHRAELVDGELIVTDPRGRRVYAEPPRRVTTPLGWPTVRAAAAAAGVTIDPATGRSRWNGRPVDHDWVVHDLVRHEFRRPD